MKSFILGVALCVSAVAAGKVVKVVNTARPTLPCRSTFHDKPTPYLYEEETLFLNFSLIALPPANESAKGYSVDMWWERVHLLKESQVSNRGTSGRFDLLQNCMHECLKINECASFVLVDSFNTKSHRGLTQCYFYTKPMNVGKHHIVKSKEDAVHRILWAYNLVCEDEQRKWLAEQEPARKKETEDKAKAEADKKQAEEEKVKNAKEAKEAKEEADNAAEESKKLAELGKWDEANRKKVSAPMTTLPV